ARHLARLYDSYAAHRPAMLQAWAAGDDRDLPGDLRWQGELWRRVRARIALPSTAERLPPACDRLRAEPGLVDLPGRLSLFGPTRLTTAHLDVLDALAEHRDVHLWLPHPSPALWDRIAPRASGVTARHDDPTADLPRNLLLASLGQDARELQLRLGSRGAAVEDHHHPLRDRPPTLLGRLQTSLQDDALPPPEPSVLQEDDRSLQVHACHGQERQVEVLRERSRQLERKVKDFVDVARENDALGTRVLTMARRLISAPGRADIIGTIEAALREDFGAGQSVLVLTPAGAPPGVTESRFLRIVPADAPDLRSFDTLFSSSKPRCGQLRDSQHEFLFGTDAAEVGSVALVPLGAKGKYGLLACGSNDTQRFNPTMSTDFLAHIGELIAAALARD
ncbi:MAG: exodeoxyribonuclease V subunit gamma, partial [Gammaproteobacteria bacterium]